MTIICGIQMWIVWTSFATMFGVLLVRTMPVVRILRNSKYTSLSPGAVYSDSGCAAVDCLGYIFQRHSSKSGQGDTVTLRHTIWGPHSGIVMYVRESCLPDHFCGYETFLVILTIFGTVSFFNYPNNFNEARYISLCSTSILVIWIASVITFFATQNNYAWATKHSHFTDSVDIRVCCLFHQLWPQALSAGVQASEEWHAACHTHGHTEDCGHFTWERREGGMGNNRGHWPKHCHPTHKSRLVSPAILVL